MDQHGHQLCEHRRLRQVRIAKKQGCRGGVADVERGGLRAGPTRASALRTPETTTSEDHQMLVVHREGGRRRSGRVRSTSEVRTGSEEQ
eukprot:355348-Chlamydomonas_euryale.AAC.4